MTRKPRKTPAAASDLPCAASSSEESLPLAFRTRGSAPVEAIILSESSPVILAETRCALDVRRIEEAATQKIADRIERRQITHATGWMLGGAFLLATISGTYGGDEAGDAIGVGGIATFLVLICGMGYGGFRDKQFAKSYRLCFDDLTSEEEAWAELISRKLGLYCGLRG